MKSSRRDGSRALILTAALLGADIAGAACTTNADWIDLYRALGRQLGCARRVVGGDDRPCPPVVPPPCGAAAVAAVVDLVGGDPGAAFDPNLAKCQRAVYSGARRFLKRRAVERSKGYRAQRRSHAAVALIGKCDVAVAATSTGPQPRLGGGCADLVATPGAILSGAAVGRCLRPQLDRLLSEALGLPALRPNVIVIVTDDQHPQAVNTMPATLSGIADCGMRFDNAFTTTPICAPSRAGILTGQHATKHGVTANGLLDHNGQVANGARALDESSTLATWFRDAGYRTALFGKYLNSYHVVSPHVPAGWDEWRAFINDTHNLFDYDLNENGTVVHYGSAVGDYSTDIIAAHALRFIDANGEQPFFAVFAPFAPHYPSEPAPRHLGQLDGLPPWRPLSWGEVDLSERPKWFRFFAVKPNVLPARDAVVRRQIESLMAVDEFVAAMLALLERRGLTDNTVIVFTADHGMMWGEHRWFNKQVAYEESIRVPLFVKYPLAITLPRRESLFALNIDIAPTLAHLAGVATGDHAFDGDSLLPVTAAWRSDFAVRHFVGGVIVPPWDALRSARYKYVRHVNPMDAAEVYDLDTDPFELNNLAKNADNAGLVTALSRRLDELLQ
jgi:arylsulfatase A-like enzyme